MPSSVRSPADTRARLAKMLPLLASDQDGEVLAAAAAIARIVSAAGWTWEQLLSGDAPIGSPSPDVAVERLFHPILGILSPPVGQTWMHTVMWLIQRRGHSPILAGQEWLDLLAVRLTQSAKLRVAPAITHEEGREICRLYDRFAGKVS